MIRPTSLFRRQLGSEIQQNMFCNSIPRAIHSLTLKASNVAIHLVPTFDDLDSPAPVLKEEVNSSLICVRIFAMDNALPAGELVDAAIQLVGILSLRPARSRGIAYLPTMGYKRGRRKRFKCCDTKVFKRVKSNTIMIIVVGVY